VERRGALLSPTAEGCLPALKQDSPVGGMPFLSCLAVRHLWWILVAGLGGSEDRENFGWVKNSKKIFHWLEIPLSGGQ